MGTKDGKDVKSTGQAVFGMFLGHHRSNRADRLDQTPASLAHRIDRSYLVYDLIHHHINGCRDPWWNFENGKAEKNGNGDCGSFGNNYQTLTAICQRLGKRSLWLTRLP